MIELSNWWKYAYEKEPDLEILKKALENEQLLITDKETRLKAIRLKYQAMTTVPTIIEKTISPEQLYATGSPLWAREHTVYELFCYMRYKMPTNYKMVKNIIRMDSMKSNAIKLLKNSEYSVIERN